MPTKLSKTPRNKRMKETIPATKARPELLATFDKSQKKTCPCYPGCFDLVVLKFSFPRQKAVPPGTVKAFLYASVSGCVHSSMGFWQCQNKRAPMSKHERIAWLQKNYPNFWQIKIKKNKEHMSFYLLSLKTLAFPDFYHPKSKTKKQKPTYRSQEARYRSLGSSPSSGSPSITDQAPNSLLTIPA